MTDEHKLSNAVFISYRRQASEDLAYAIYQGLKLRQIDPFFDYQSIPAGRWLETILRQIAARPYFLLVLAPGTLERCANPDDILRREIQEAVNLERVIVPLTTDKFNRDDVTKYLPPSLAKAVNDFQGLDLPSSRTYFEAAFDALVDRYLKPIPLVVKPPPISDLELLRVNQIKVDEAVAAPLFATISEPPQSGQTPAESVVTKPGANCLLIAGGGVGFVAVIAILLFGVAAALNQSKPTLTPASTGTASIAPSVTEVLTGTYSAQTRIAAAVSPTITRTPSATVTSTFTPSATYTATATATPTLIPVGALVTPTIYGRMSVQGVSFVYVPRGCFKMGSNSGEADEQPIHNVCLTHGYWISEFEITNSQFNDYLNKSGATPVKLSSPSSSSSKCLAASNPENAMQPVNCVPWIEAKAFAEALGGRLPTEAEWEYAARGPTSGLFPWYGASDSKKANTTEGGPGKTTAVGSYPDGKSWIGAQDMAGNVWEWVSDWYSATYYQSSPPNDPTGPEEGVFYILRGGAWGRPQGQARTTFRYSLTTSSIVSFDDIGIRVVIVDHSASS